AHFRVQSTALRRVSHLFSVKLRVQSTRFAPTYGKIEILMIRTSLFALFATTALLAQVPPAAPAAPAREPGLYATITTSMGPIVCILYEKESPITVKNFVALARGGTKAWTDPKTKTKTTRPLYSGTIFH